MVNINASAAKQTTNAGPLEAQTAEDVAAMLSLSMPRTAVYPEVFFDRLAQAPEHVLERLCEKPKKAYTRFCAEIEKQNRKDCKRNNATKAQAVSSEDAKAAAKTAKVTMQRRHWYLVQMQKMCVDEDEAKSVAF